jgi:hypothetical protein
MVLTRPFNEEYLWKGTIQIANYPEPSTKRPMILPIINLLTGYVTDPRIKPDDMSKSYSIYSQKYWSDVEKRKRIYRENNRIY